MRRTEIEARLGQPMLIDLNRRKKYGRGSFWRIGTPLRWVSEREELDVEGPGWNMGRFHREGAWHAHKEGFLVRYEMPTTEVREHVVRNAERWAGEYGVIPSLLFVGDYAAAEAMAREARADSERRDENRRTWQPVIDGLERTGLKEAGLRVRRPETASAALSVPAHVRTTADGLAFLGFIGTVASIMDAEVRARFDVSGRAISAEEAARMHAALDGVGGQYLQPKRLADMSAYVRAGFALRSVDIPDERVARTALWAWENKPAARS